MDYKTYLYRGLQIGFEAIASISCGLSYRAILAIALKLLNHLHSSLKALSRSTVDC
jgi:hypothetical protein